MFDKKTPQMKHFTWDIDVHFSSNSEVNPLYDERVNDPEYIVENHLRAMQHDIDLFSSDPNSPVTGQGDPIHIGIDCEYQYDPVTGKNDLLCYQFSAYTPLGVLSGIVYTKNGKRIDFNTFLGVIIKLAKQNKLISHLPKIVYVYAHFMRADITHFQDFWSSIHNNIDALRGTVASIKSDYSSDFTNDASVKFKPEPLYLKDTHRHTFRTYVRYIDTLLITPGNQGLDAAGELIGVPKLELPPGYSKSDMRRVLDEQPEFFKEYAIRDAEIAVLYGLKMRQFVEDELNLSHLPVTIGAFATNAFFKIPDIENVNGLSS